MLFMREEPRTHRRPHHQHRRDASSTLVTGQSIDETRPKLDTTNILVDLPAANG
jgi:hypothetical protein